MPPSTADPWPPPAPPDPLAVLVSGGLDSAVMVAEAARAYPAVYPIFVRAGSRWESVEEDHLRRFLAALHAPALRPLTVLAQPADDLYRDHWSVTGRDVPGAGTPDAAVFLPGRNVLLFAKPLLWCHLHGVPELATAPLASNPFPDATPAFYDGYAALVDQAVGGSVRIVRPYAGLGLHKRDVLRRGAGLPLELTFSCIDPSDGRHCGRCNKCAERRDGFRDAGVVDRTNYGAVKS